MSETQIMNAIKSYFNFTKGERNAAFFLLLLALFFFILPSFFHAKNYPISDFKTMEQMAILDSVSAASKSARKGSKLWINQSKKVFNFEPNQLAKERWVELGFSPFVAERIDKYRKAGARFKTKNDLMKIYGIDQELVTELWSNILLPETFDKPVQDKKTNNGIHAFQKQVIEINTADTNQLIALPLIGNKLANRIVKYRDKLGGFYKIEQVLEVYGLKPETYELIKERLRVDIKKIKLIDINTCDKTELEKHPYVGYKCASIVINYRQQHGPYSNAEDLKRVHVLTDESIEKLKNYIKFN